MPFDFETALAPLADNNTPEGGTPAPESNNQPAGAPAPAITQPDGGTPPAAPTPALNTQSQPNTPAVPTGPSDADYNNFLDRMSGGLIKDENGFKSVLPQLTEYPTLKSQLTELTSKLEKAPKFANDEVRIYNDLVAGGASKEQLQSFQQINAVGDLKELTPTEARIARMVLVDGVKPSVAKMKVEREFKIGENYSNVDPEEREILDEDLRVASNKDREELAKFKAQVSQTTQAAPEELALQQEARVQQHSAQIKPYVKDLVTGLPHLGNFSLIDADAAKGIDGLSYEVPINDAAKQEIGQYVENYFMDGLTPVTHENTYTALAYARAEYFRLHAGDIFKSVADFLIPKIQEDVESRYENRSGLKPTPENPNPGQNPGAATAEMMNNIANRRRD